MGQDELPPELRQCPPAPSQAAHTARVYCHSHRGEGRKQQECRVPGRSSSSKGESPAGPQGAQICPLHLHPSHSGSPSLQARALPSSPPKSSAGCHRRPSAPAPTRARDMRFCRGQGTLQTCAQRWTSLVLWHRAVGEAGQQE